jgi:hypothetical protein
MQILPVSQVFGAERSIPDHPEFRPPRFDFESLSPHRISYATPIPQSTDEAGHCGVTVPPATY